MNNIYNRAEEIVIH
ncbi:MAG: hypothetical protein ACLUTU_01530 [Blautia faecis]